MTQFDPVCFLNLKVGPSVALILFLPGHIQMPEISGHLQPEPDFVEDVHVLGAMGVVSTSPCLLAGFHSSASLLIAARFFAHVVVCLVVRHRWDLLAVL